MHVLAKVVLSFMVTSWIYAELVLFFPVVGQFGERFVQVFRIPTHDEWPAIAESPEADQLHTELTSLVAQIGREEQYAGLMRQVRGFWLRLPGFGADDRQHVAALQASTRWSPFEARREETGSPNYFNFAGEVSPF